MTASDIAGIVLLLALAALLLVIVATTVEARRLRRSSPCGDCECCSPGEHRCEPPRFPTVLGEEWTCPECDVRHESFAIHDADNIPEAVKRHVPAGALGWRSIVVRPVRTLP